MTFFQTRNLIHLNVKSLFTVLFTILLCCIGLATCLRKTFVYLKSNRYWITLRLILKDR